jgi:hypothetical protein
VTFTKVLIFQCTYYTTNITRNNTHTLEIYGALKSSLLNLLISQLPFKTKCCPNFLLMMHKTLPTAFHWCFIVGPVVCIQ